MGRSGALGTQLGETLRDRRSTGDMVSPQRLRTLRRHRPAWAKFPQLLVLAALTAVVVVTSCSSASGGSTYSDQIQAVDSFADITRPSIAVGTAGGGRLAPNAVVEPGLPIVVSARRGALTKVEIPTASGRAVAGSLSEDGSTWISTQPLGYSKRYSVRAEAVGVGGRLSVSQGFSTASPESLTSAVILGEKTVGIAHTVGVRFADPIPDRKKAQDAITVTSDDPQMQGAFYWISDSEVRWRPERFWTPGTKVSVAVNIYGVDLGDGLYGNRNLSYDFAIGRAQEIEADDTTKTIVVKRDGKVIRTMPTSFGKDSTPTPRGIYMIGDRVEHIIMDSSTYGVPVESSAGYRTPVEWAVQMSYSGIYMHGAPWSMAAQGNSNVSNGCPNLSPADAEWLVKNTLRGDPVTVKNTNAETLSGIDGLGDWNIPWSQWKKGNADT